MPGVSIYVRCPYPLAVPSMRLRGLRLRDLTQGLYGGELVWPLQGYLTPGGPGYGGRWPRWTGGR